MKETTPTFPLLASRGLPPRPLPPRTACMPPFPALEAEWNITQHIYPAAFPRSKKGSTVSKSSNRLGRISAQEIDQLAEDVLQRQYQAEYTDLNEIKDVQALWIAVNRYKPNAPPPQGKKGITLTFAHANGMHKETWEPTISYLLRKLSSLDSQCYIEEVWSFDLCNQGDSAILNADHLGPVFDWIDYARDIANFFIRYLPSKDSPALPYLLPEQPISSAEKELFKLSSMPAKQKQPKWRGRQIIACGHSVGGASTLQAVAVLPSLFFGLVLIDPVMDSTFSSDQIHINANLVKRLGKGALIRRDEWQDRQTAQEMMKKNKHFYGKWHPDVLKRYTEFGLKDLPNGKVGLKCERYSEAVTFIDPDVQGARNAFSKLGILPATLQCHFILANASVSTIDSRGTTTEKLLMTARNTKPTLTRLNESGHLIAQEQPELLGNELANVLDRWTADLKAKL